MGSYIHILGSYWDLIYIIWDPIGILYLYRDPIQEWFLPSEPGRWGEATTFTEVVVLDESQAL